MDCHQSCFPKLPNNRGQSLNASVGGFLFNFQHPKHLVALVINTRQLVQNNAAEIVRLRKQILETLPYRDKGPKQLAEWSAACTEFHDQYESLAFPGGTLSARRRMRAGNQEAIEYGIAFLEVRPYFFRSGYMYQEYMRVLRNCPLSKSQRHRYDRIREKYMIYRENCRRSP